MADKTIGQLPVAEGLGFDDLFIVEQNGNLFLTVMLLVMCSLFGVRVKLMRRI